MHHLVATLKGQLGAVSISAGWRECVSVTRILEHCDGKGHGAL